MSIRHKRPSGDGYYIWSRRCTVTGEPYSVEFKYKDYELYSSGKKLIGEALPDLSQDERNFLTHNLTPEEFKQYENNTE